ncbi:hypothetical protein [Mucilaginibacter flavus]|uniref:hypothetical protein n=1 Tax=Mucilaginibacter flavus TaxID=931504 RepID=UPI0025B44330|nr:hypothetical protein [Mucilaginibacter flavus]MDN3581279.1 hypothetical protein [Mucilaginibacter flavus]
MGANSKPNPHQVLNLVATATDLQWVSKNTAILVVHGIGNQLPLETIDQFGRGLIQQYRAEYREGFSISHKIVSKKSDDNGVWFDNALRLQKDDSEYFIDIYEYYWADYTEDKASWKDLNTWLQGVVNGAEKFYKRNGQIGEQYKDKSPFFDTKTGKFKVGIYRFFMSVVSKVFLFIDMIWRIIIWLISLIPFLGKFADSLLQSYADTIVHDLTNILGDVAVYNVVDPKSKFYGVRRKILDGAVKAIKYLVERPADDDFDLQAVVDKVKENKLGLNTVEKSALDEELELELRCQHLFYSSVVIAGHSLGSQVAYDAINKINLLVNEGELLNYDKNALCKFGDEEHAHMLSEQLCGFITFGCPLDKIVFFLRENVSDNEYLRQQFLDNYHGFKQRPLNTANSEKTNKKYMRLPCNMEKRLDAIKWRNYYDSKDYISGGLDYYTKLTNIDCRFKAGTFGFTHSYYWDCPRFYADIIDNFLV